MEPWNCLSDGEGTCFDYQMDPLGRSRNSIFGTDHKSSSNFDNDGLMSEFVDIGLPDAMRKQFSSGSGKADGDFGVKAASSCLIASSWSSGMKECYPKLSNSLVGSNLGEVLISDPGFSKDRSAITSLNPSPQAKKARLIGSCSQNPLCQVHGCNIDLSSSKDYHKRHRVCEAHSKTATVIVNGIEQRFCQQCSRFHLLTEFDDGKRSCRRRLAGHNERRRKPPFHFLSSKQQKLHHSYKGSKLFEVYSGGFSFEDRYEQNKNCRIIKFEDRSICSPQPAMAFLKGHLRKKPSLSHCALSLLSGQPHDFSHQVTGTPYVRFSQATRVHQNMGRNFEKDLDVTRRSDSKVFNVETDMFFKDSTYQNPGPINPPTVDLYQLSSHLQRVEQQKTSVQVKHETAEPCYFLGT